MASLIIEIIYATGFVALGLLGHEGLHYTLGAIAGGNPFVSKYHWLFPSEIDFETPHEMGDSWTKAVGGSVLIFPAIALAGAYTHNISVLAFGIGGSGVSWLDSLAVKHPEKWKSYTAWEPIKRDE